MIQRVRWFALPADVVQGAAADTEVEYPLVPRTIDVPASTQ